MSLALFKASPWAFAPAATARLHPDPAGIAADGGAQPNDRQQRENGNAVDDPRLLQTLA